MSYQFEPGYEVLCDVDLRGRRGKAMMSALHGTMGADSIAPATYSGKKKNLILYGPGMDWRTAVFHAHRKKGGNVICWDLGYWDRESALRMSINNFHPTAKQLAYSEGRLRSPQPRHELREDADPNGQILLIGLGPKACLLYGLKPYQWETQMLQAIRDRFPGVGIVWRPKGHRPLPFNNLTISHDEPIEEALKGKRMVVCRHSNVAVDAAVAGVPVWCSDGAARAIYGETEHPTREARAKFLEQLEWWNWAPEEAQEGGMLWSWINHVVAKEEGL